MNQYNVIYGGKPPETPIQFNSKTIAVHLKSCKYAPKHIPVVSSIMVRLHYHAVDNGDFEVYPEDYPPDMDNTTIKYINDD